MMIIVQKVLSISASLIVLSSPIVVGGSIFMLSDTFTKNKNVITTENNPVTQNNTTSSNKEHVVVSPKIPMQHISVNNSHINQHSSSTKQQPTQNNEQAIFNQELNNKKNKLSEYRLNYYNSWHSINQIMWYGNQSNTIHNYMHACDKDYASKSYDLTFDLSIKIKSRSTGATACVPFSSVKEGQYHSYPTLLPENTRYTTISSTRHINQHQQKEYKGFILNFQKLFKFFISDSMTTVTVKTYKEILWRNEYKELESKTTTIQNITGYNNIVKYFRNVGENILKYSQQIRTINQEIATYIRANNHLINNAEQLATEYENLNY